MFSKKPHSVLIGAMVAAGLVTQEKNSSVFITGVTPYDKLETTSDGFKKHSGIASGGQEVHSIQSKITMNGSGKGKHTVQLKVGAQEITVLTTDAEVGLVQLIGRLAEINKGIGS